VVPVRSLLLLVLGCVAWLGACADEPPRPAYRGDGVCYPVALEADPAGRYLYVAGANFDRAFRGGVVRAFDTKEGAFTGGPTVEVPSYVSAMALKPVVGQSTKASADARYRLWVADRDKDRVTTIEVKRQGGGEPVLGCNGTAKDSCPEECGDKASFGGEAPGDLDLGVDPIELTVSDDPHGEGELVTVAATSDRGRVSVLSATEKADGAMTVEALDHVELSFGLAAVLTSPLTGRTYVSDSRSPYLHSFSIGEGAATSETDSTPIREIAPHPAIRLPWAGQGEYGRGMALSVDGGRIYLAYRNPNALVIVDIAPGVDGEPADRLLGVIGLGGSPARVTVANSGQGGRELVYVSCYGSDDIWIVDPQQRAVRGTIRLPHSPYDLAVLDDGTGAFALYAGLFTRHSLIKVPLLDGVPPAGNAADYLTEYRTGDCAASTDPEEVKACD